MSKIAVQVNKYLDDNPTKNIQVEINGPIMNITLNRPERSNSFTLDMYRNIGKAIRQANRNDKIKVIVMKGRGKNFSSGNDLMNFSNPDYLQFEIVEFTTFVAHDILEDYAKAIVESKKPIAAVVQGKVLGVAFTQLALFDKVFGIEGTTFKAPLVKLSQGPEMASAYTFPKIFGASLSKEIIIGAKQITAKEAEKCGLIDVCKDMAEAEKKLQRYIGQIDGLDWPSYVQCRRLMMHFEKPKILEINHLECKNLIDRWLNPQLPQAMIKYLSETKNPLPKL